jgi:hypothetical protein
MFFSDLANCGGPTGWKSNWKEYAEKANFKNVMTKTYKLENAARGLCEFVPIKFTGYYNS